MLNVYHGKSLLTGPARHGGLLVLALLCLLSANRLAIAIPAVLPLAQCRVDTWGSRDGLPGYEITAIQQTPDGFIWLGTINGLVRFDGERYLLFNHTNVAGLTNDIVRSLGLDSTGKLLVGVEWEGFGTLDNGEFHRIPYPDTRWNSTHSFHSSPDGTLWVGYQGWNNVLRVANGIVNKVVLQGGYAAGVVDLPDGSVLVGMNDGGLFTVSSDGSVAPFRPAPPGVVDVTALVQARDGSIWVGTDTEGVYVINGSKITHYSTANGLSSNAVICLCPNREGGVWIGTTSGIDSVGVHGVQHFDVSNGLQSNRVNALMEDREGSLWAGTGNGLNRIAQTKLTPVGIGPLATGEIVGIASYGNNDVLCATPTGLWRVPSAIGAVPELIKSDNVLGAVDAGGGDIIAWRQLPRNRYQVIREHAGAWRQIAVVDFQPFTAIAKGSGYDFYGINGRFQHLPGDTTSRPLWSGLKGTRNDAAPDMQIYDLRTLPDGSVVIASTLGLTVYNNGVHRQINLGIPSDTHVLSVDTSDPRIWWVGTDLGLIRYEPSHSIRYSAASGLPVDITVQVRRDQNGTVWIAGYYGIAAISPEDFQAFDHKVTSKLRMTLYTSADGIRSSPAVRMPVETPSGVLWFIGFNGLTMIQPDHIETNTLAPSVTIEDGVVNGVSVDPGRDVAVHPGDGSFSARFAALSFVEPEKVRFRYRLDGFDTSWINADGRDAAAYTNLPPGSYSFHVIACNNDNVWNLVGATVNFTIEPHYYQTGWFRALVVTVVLLLAFSVFGLRTRQLGLRNAELERRVAERTAEVVERNEELQALQGELEERHDQLESQQIELEAQNDELLAARGQLEMQNETLEKLATTDGLTGLLNRRSLQNALEQEMRRSLRYDNQISMMMLDVDHFKKYNDTFGHPAGDSVLQTVASILRENSRETDIVARYGGEEFAVLMPQTDVATAYRVAERLREAVESHAWTERKITASVGVASSFQGKPDEQGLISLADEGLYLSKQHGRNRVTVARVQMNQSKVA